LLYDQQTESLWSQLLEKAISGPLAGKRLRKLPASRRSWETWRKEHPDTLVLSTKTGYSRDYFRDPYAGYYRIGTIWFPVGEVRKDLSPKERIMGLEVNNETKAYPLAKLREQSGVLEDTLAGKTVKIRVSSEGEVVSVTNKQGDELPHIFAFWFAWQAFHPETTVYQGEE